MAAPSSDCASLAGWRLKHWAHCYCRPPSGQPAAAGRRRCSTAASLSTAPTLAGPPERSPAARPLPPRPSPAPPTRLAGQTQRTAQKNDTVLPLTPRFSSNPVLPTRHPSTRPKQPSDHATRMASTPTATPFAPLAWRASGAAPSSMRNSRKVHADFRGTSARIYANSS